MIHAEDGLIWVMFLYPDLILNIMIYDPFAAKKAPPPLQELHEA